MAFKVKEIKSAGLIEVEPRWSWNGQTGSLVKIPGFNSISPNTTDFIITKLNTLILGKDVDLKNPVNGILNIENNAQIEASVYLNNIDITVYFPELKTPA
jgi:hypothetical protein